MLALHGFDAYGLEISTDAVAAAEAYSASEMGAPSAYSFSRAGSDTPGSAGGVTFLQGDFFQRDWELATPLEGDAKFDLIYDYTVSPISDWNLTFLKILVPMCASPRDAEKLGDADGRLTQAGRSACLSRISALQGPQASWATMGP
jgi:hypothetical protein